MICPQCKNDIKFKHLHDCVHGISETHIVNTERFVCPSCGKAYFKYEGEKHGFKYILD